MHTELSESQLKQYVDAEQVRKAWLEAERRSINYRGSMYWATVKGREYLYREYKKGQGKSQGPKSPETEKILNDFRSGKMAAEARLASLTTILKENMRVNLALRVGRTPNVVVDLLEQIRKSGLQDHFLVIGTNALYAYETHAGVRFDGGITATADVDLLWDSRKRITLVADGDEDFRNTGLIGLLQKIDPTFQIMEEEKFRAVNAKGYMVDLIKRRPVSLHDDAESQQVLDNHPEDFWAVKIRNMDWLLSSPKFRQVVVALNGSMAEMTTVDPRAFALYKVFLSEKENRDPVKAKRDLAQARAVYSLVEEKMPHLAFNQVHALPEKLRNERVMSKLNPSRG